MKLQELKTYLGEAVNLETAHYQHEAALKVIDEKIAMTNINVGIDELKLELSYYRTTEFEDHIFWRLPVGFWKGMAGVVAFAALCIAWSSPGKYLNDGSNGMASMIILFCILYPAVALCFVMINVFIFLIAWCKNRIINQQIQRSNDRKMERSQEAYQAAVMEHSKQVLRQEDTREKLMLTRTRLAQNATELSNVLYAHYQKNVLHPKYRNIAAVTQLLEYLETGVAQQLEGPYGAYAQYLLDERNNRICVRLEEIADRLQLIAQTQYGLYQRIQQMQASLQELTQSLGSMEKQLYRLSGAVVEAEKYRKEVLPLLKNMVDSVNQTALNSYVSAMNQYYQATIDRYLLLYPKKG